LEINHGIPLISFPRAPLIAAVSEILGLSNFSGPSSMPRVNRYQAFCARGAEAAGVLLVDYSAAGEDHLVVRFGNRKRKLTPVQEVTAYSVPPTHVPPLIAEGVVLKEEVVLTVKVDEAIRIVRPMCSWREMDLGTITFSVDGPSDGER